MLTTTANGDLRIVSRYAIADDRMPAAQRNALCKLFGTIVGDARCDAQNGYSKSARGRAALARELIAAFGQRMPQQHETIIPLREQPRDEARRLPRAAGRVE
jgi:hypothetical protein